MMDPAAIINSRLLLYKLTCRILRNVARTSQDSAVCASAGSAIYRKPLFADDVCERASNGPLLDAFAIPPDRICSWTLTQPMPPSPATQRPLDERRHDEIGTFSAVGTCSVASDVSGASVDLCSTITRLRERRARPVLDVCAVAKVDCLMSGVALLICLDAVEGH